MDTYLGQLQNKLDILYATKSYFASPVDLEGIFLMNASL